MTDSFDKTFEELRLERAAIRGHLQALNDRCDLAYLWLANMADQIRHITGRHHAQTAGQPSKRQKTGGSHSTPMEESPPPS